MNKQKILPSRLISWRLVWCLAALAFILVVATGVAIVHEMNNVSPRTSQTADTDDWPTYLHDPEHSAASADKILSPANASQLTRLWTFNTGDVVAPSPAIVGDTVYVGSWSGYEYALDANTGAMKWKTYLGKTTPPANCYPPYAGVTSGAAVQNNVVYVGGGDAYWYALDAKTGKVLWKIYTGDNSATAGHYNWASPLLYNGYAFIGIASYGDCPLVPGQVLKVSLSTHQIAATATLVPNGQVGAGVWTSPTLDPVTNTLYITTGTDGYNNSQQYAQAFVALNADTLKITDSWKLPESQTVHDSDFGNTPTLMTDSAGNRLVVAINKNGYAYAFKVGHLSAGPIWQQSIAIGGDCPWCGDGSVSSGAFANGTLYLAGGNTSINGAGYIGSVRAIDPATGKFLWQHGTAGYIIAALTYSNGLILDGTGQTFEVLDAANGKRLYSYQTGQTIYSEPSVSRGRIYFGSGDGNVYAFGLPSTPPSQPHADANCPKGWSCQDIGAPAPAGSETSANNAWKVTAGGAGVAGTADQFRFTAQTVSGDTQIAAQVAAQQSPDGSNPQAGLMVRQDSSPGSPYYALFSTGAGVVVQYRAAFGGGTTTITQQTRPGLPLYLEVQRIGDLFQAATSPDGVTYTLVPNTTTTLMMPNAALVGLASSSGKTGAVSSTTYSAVTVGAPAASPQSQQSATPCPASWTCGDFGNPALIGSQSLQGGIWTIQAGGSDIWDAWDQFHYVWQSLSGDGSMSAHILSQTKTDPSAKAGVMLRDGSGPNSAYYAVFVTPGNGIQVQYRALQGISAQYVTSISGATPIYVQVRRSGDTFTAYTSQNGFTWTAIDGSDITLNMPDTLQAGLAVTSHNSNALCMATINDVRIDQG
jgi:outer membrane protein assembly factor BamB